MPAEPPVALSSLVSPPELVLSSDPPLAVPGAEVVALPVLPAGADGAGPALGPGAAAVADALGLALLDLLEAAGAAGTAGEVTTLPVAAGADAPDLRCLLLVGVGEQRPGDLRRAGAALARACRGRSTVVTTLPTVADLDRLEAFVVGAVLGSYSFRLGAVRAEDQAADRFVVAGLPDGRDVAAALDRSLAVARAGWRARTLAAVPSNIKSPAWLADQAAALAAETGLDCRVWDERQLADGGFGGILGVGQASATPPRLVRLDYTPRGGRRAPRVVLVGKGITFDSGGLSIKPAEGMATMKRDMTGGAVVISVMAALAEVGCPVRVTGLVAAAENAVGGNALRPGDVVRHHGGRTTEVTNTDAEGRVVMADALAYAAAELDPAVMVDVATLTGAMKVALGQQLGGYFANDEALARALREAGEASGEALWRMPLAAEYEEKLASKVADADNAPGGPGAITAALFLQHFTGGVPWAHLDIASVGDAPEDRDEWSAGPTGFGARVLLHWLGSADPLAGVGSR